VDEGINKDFDPFELDWMDRRKATRVFSSAVKKKMISFQEISFPWMIKLNLNQILYWIYYPTIR
jgi:hypothetical protein